MSDYQPPLSPLSPPTPPHQDVSLPVSEDPLPEPGSRYGKAHHVLATFALLALVAWLLSGIYTVNADEVVIVERLGKYQSASADGNVATVGQGLHYRMPWPIDRIHRIPIQRASTVVLKTFNEPPDAYADFKRKLANVMRPEVMSAIYDPYLITGDKNIVHMEIAVTYRLDDPDAWVNTVAHDVNEGGSEGRREELFRRLVEHAMISQVATMKVDNILSEGSDRLPALLSGSLAKQMDIVDPRDSSGKKRLGLGIRVEKLDVVAARPPTWVQGAFDQVFRARADREAQKIRAQADANGKIVQAQAETSTQIQSAEAYKSQVVDAARGEASRFEQIFEQYKVAPDITSWTIYVDAVKSVSGNATRMMFAQPGQHLTLTVDPPQFDAAAAAPK